jgi:O-acetyl-ADP-ribose deacetylase (regulator of RNase III)
LFVIDGDITSVAVDGVVSNDDVDGRMYTVIASSIKAGAGPDVERQSIAQGPFRRGDAWHTDAGTLSSPIRLVIHIAAMDRRGDTDPGTIEQCVISALEEARAQELDSIALAAFGTGPRGSGPKVIEMHQWLTDVSETIVRQFAEWQREDEAAGKSDLKVLIVLYGEDLDTAVETLCKATHGDIPPATTPPVWPGTARVIDAMELVKDIIQRDARLVAIDGPRGAGKSTFARELAGQWPGAVVIGMEDFYLPSRSVHLPRRRPATTTVSA